MSRRAGRWVRRKLRELEKKLKFLSITESTAYTEEKRARIKAERERDIARAEANKWRPRVNVQRGQDRLQYTFAIDWATIAYARDRDVIFEDMMNQVRHSFDDLLRQKNNF